MLIDEDSDEVANETTSVKSTFSVKEAIDDILTGESIHDSRIRLAMHWANSSMPKVDALATLTGYVEDAIRSGTVTTAELWSVLVICVKL